MNVNKRFCVQNVLYVNGHNFAKTECFTINEGSILVNFNTRNSKKKVTFTKNEAMKSYYM